jgi:AraC-like DNA-binding protein
MFGPFWCYHRSIEPLGLFYTEHAMILSPELFKERIASISVSQTQSQTRTVLPGTSAVLGLQLRGQVRAGETYLSSAGITGIQPTARRYEYIGETTSVLVRFSPQGATCLGVPASELFGRSVSLDEVLPVWRVRELQERIQENPAQAVSLVGSFLAGLPFTRDRLITRAIAMLETFPEKDALVSEVARELGLSERQLERRFLQRVGMTPKRYTALHRFERTLALLGGVSSLTSAALDAGYYDQSHFIREFRRFAGTTPGRFLRGSR